MSLTTNTNLNLARKWRPQTFDTIIGQDIPVRMLKNSLYLKKFFPVYLFAGQRGCGKTTSARVFAAAVNCHNLAAFQTDPTKPIPCMTCTSCVAMSNGDHPDFIEIDAASHTGVDNVRQIIESSNYLPLTGQKKIYLIDEAHMLSKAAFNAFLKILEEPPMTVMFMLATTDTPKIPATVLSRCFQLTFPPIEVTTLKKHLQHLCDEEKVEIEPAALDIILQETEGSARDAINLLERVRFSGDAITEASILTILGKIGGSDMIVLLDGIVHQRPEIIINHLQAINFYTRSAHALWDMMILCCRSMLWLKHGVKQLPLSMQGIQSQLAQFAATCPISRLHAMLTLLWTQEALFNQTNKKHLFLETVLLQLADQANIVDLDQILAHKPTALRTPTTTPSTQTAPLRSQPAPQNVSSPVVTAPLPVQQIPTTPPVTNSQPWQQFLTQITVANDLMLASIFMQATFIGSNKTNTKIVIALSSGGAFITNKIDESSSVWLPLLKTAFGPEYLGFEYQMGTPAPRPAPPTSAPSTRPPLGPQAQNTPQPTQNFAPNNNNQYYQNRGSAGPSAQPAPKEELLVIKNPAEWPVASLLLSHFSGKIKKVESI